jgi:hypothetical protein
MITHKDIFSVSSASELFAETALQVFCYQYDNNEIYRNFAQLLRRTPKQVLTLEEIPFLPISFFKTHRIQSGAWHPERIFRSSGTSGMERSCHLVKEMALYERSFTDGFRSFYGAPDEYCFLALLPSYLERKDSSLIYMLQELMKQSGHPDNGFYLDDYPQLNRKLHDLERAGQKTLLWGVAYALLDFSEQYPMPLRNTTVIETGGMKGKRREMLRCELHEILCRRFEVEHIHSEYGMAELFSQAYSKGNGIFQTPPWMRVMMRQPDDPLTYSQIGKKGGINVIDLANTHSCSFIATQDLGTLFPNDTFEVSGRFDDADLRGCNLMVDG